MGLLSRFKLPTSKIGEGLGKAAESLGDIAKKATVDKDKLAEIKKQLEEMGYTADKEARQMYETELEEIKGPFINFFRAIVRPLWGIVGGVAFGFECGTIIYSWIIKIRNPDLVIPNFSYPAAVHTLLITIAGFYFGSRIYEKFMKNKDKSKFIEKWGL